MEASDDRGEAYEVQVRLNDGTEVDVSLDKDLTVVSQEAEGRDDTEDGDRDDSTDAPENDDRALSATERASAEKAALNAVNTGGRSPRWRPVTTGARPTRLRCVLATAPSGTLSWTPTSRC